MIHLRIFMKNDKRNMASVTFPDVTIDPDINHNIQKIRSELGESCDIVVNLIDFKSNSNLQCAQVYLKTLVDDKTINSMISELNRLNERFLTVKNDNDLDVLVKSLSVFRDSTVGSDYENLFSELLSGNCIYLIDGYLNYISVSSKSIEGRSIAEPTSQTIIRGPKDCFTEKILSNLMLVRSRIKNKALKADIMTLGNVSKTTISLMYITNIAKEEIVQEIKSRLEKINIDAILEGGYIEELIKDDRYSIFPTFLSSEKPDSVAAAILEGRVAIFVDGTPYVLTAPALMIEFLQSSEDYYHHFIISSAMRILRLGALFLTLLVPSIYVSVVNFHQEMIPTPLLISLAAQREGVPFPAFIEVLIMEVIFEILKEGGVRMPRAAGSAISIVGALVLGQATVQAGIISAAVVIVVSITAISSFAIPNYEMSNAIRLARFTFIVLAGTMGLYGVFIGLLILTLHLCKMESIHVPYLTPIAPRVKGGNKDTFFRYPLWRMKERPMGISGTKDARIGENNLN